MDGDAVSDETMTWDEVADMGALLHELDDGHPVRRLAFRRSTVATVTHPGAVVPMTLPCDLRRTRMRCAFSIVRAIVWPDRRGLSAGEANGCGARG